MLDEDLGREENVAELALHGDSVLEDSLVDFDRVHFLSQLPIPFFYVRDRL